MKKTLVAMAVMAVAGAASAQVTLYGRIDTSLQFTSATSAQTGYKLDQTTIGSGAMSGSRWGMKGTEDLGGGMAANFTLEAGFNSATGGSGSNAGGFYGSSGSAGFGRTASVGVSGGFGSLSFGRIYTPYDNAFGSNDAQGYSGRSASNTLYGGIHGDDGRQDNSISYNLPAMGGIVGQLMYAPGGNATAPTAAVAATAPDLTTTPIKLGTAAVAAGAAKSAGNYLGLWLGYSAGPLGVHFANETINFQGGGDALSSNLLGGTYDLGMAKIGAMWETASKGNATETGYNLSVAVPVGAHEINAGYSRETTEKAAASTATVTTFNGVRSAWNVTGIYNLSKRTNVYAAYTSGTFQADAATKLATEVDAPVSNLSFGVRHSF